MPKLSIITPVFRVEEDIRQCIESVLNQEYQDWELILVDDCSPDASGRICDEYADKDQRIRVLHQQRNGGAAKARRSGMEIACGEYIGFVDADDWIQPNMYAVLVDRLEQLSVDVVMCSYFVNVKNKEWAKSNSKDTTLFTGEEALKRLHLADGSISAMLWDKLFRREVLADYENEVEIVVGEDYSLLVKTIERCSRLASVDVPLYHYRQRMKSVCNAGYTDKRWLTIENYYSFRSYLLEKYPQMEDILNMYCLIEEMAVLVSMAKNGNYDWKAVRTIRKDVRKYYKSLFRIPECQMVYRVSALIILFSPKLMLLISKLRFGIQKNELY